MTEFGSKKYRKIYEELETLGIDTSKITDKRQLYIELVRAKGTPVRKGFQPTFEEAHAALANYRHGHELHVIEGMAAEPLPPSQNLDSPRLAKRNMCKGKFAYYTAAKAQAVIDGSQYENRDLLTVYRCFYCGKHHIGHIIKPWLNKST